jgi:hypothetical protein
VDIGTGIALASAVVPVVAILNRMLPAAGAMNGKRFSIDLCKEKHNSVDEQIVEIKRDIEKLEEKVLNICRHTPLH